MGILRKVVTGGLAVLAALLMVAGTSAAAPTSAADERLNAPSCNVQSHPTKQIWKNVWKTAEAYSIKGDGTKTKKGVLTAGDRYFYCQKNWGEGYRVTVKDGPYTYTNTWWALTDVPGASRVWVNVVYLKGGKNNQPEPGLPTGT
jgi:hypothetical protein